jgi:hypothetical protein
MHKELSIVPRTNLVGGGVEALLCLLKGRSLCRKAKGRNGKRTEWEESRLEPSVVVHAYDPSYLGSGGRKIRV